LNNIPLAWDAIDMDIEHGKKNRHTNRFFSHKVFICFMIDANDMTVCRGNNKPNFRRDHPFRVPEEKNDKQGQDCRDNSPFDGNDAE
jgi:hypothetical protein